LKLTYSNRTKPDNEKELVRSVQKGDEKAFEILFDFYKSRVKGFVHKMLPPNISSERIVLETFVRVWINRKKIDITKSFSSYLFAISKNLVLDELKSAVNRRLVYTENYLLEEVISPQELDDFTEEQLDKKLLTVIQKLPERRRTIFWLNRFEGLTYKQIASKLSISENTVDTQIRKSLKFLRKEFNNIL
jgi:RNA polymerase sigma-70 factor (ECF subfamily)